MPRPPFRASCLALALGTLTTAACTGPTPPPPAATKIATLDPVSSHGYVDAVALTLDAALVATGERAAAVTIEGTIYVWDVATGKAMFDHADKEAGGPPPGSLRFAVDGALLATAGDRYGMQHIDVARKRSRDLTNGPKAYATVAITDSGSAFAAATSSMVGSRLIYAVEVWRIDAPRTVTAAGPGR